jgi:hypothetical protein
MRRVTFVLSLSSLSRGSRESSDYETSGTLEESQVLVSEKFGALGKGSLSPTKETQEFRYRSRPRECGEKPAAL